MFCSVPGVSPVILLIQMYIEIPPGYCGAISVIFQIGNKKRKISRIPARIIKYRGRFFIFDLLFFSHREHRGFHRERGAIISFEHFVISFVFLCEK
jgi:hypothetical protein